MKSTDGLYSTSVIADLFGVTVRRVQQLAQKKIIPKAGKALFDLGPTVQAYIRYLQGLINGAISADSAELNQRLLQAQAEEREAKARMAGLDLSVMQGRLHDADHVKKIMTDMIIACKSQLLAIPSKASTIVAGMTDPAEVMTYLRSLINEALESLSEYDAEKFNKLNDKYVPPGIPEESDASATGEDS